MPCFTKLLSNTPSKVVINVSIFVCFTKLASKTASIPTKFVFVEATISPNVSPLPSVFAVILFWILFNLEAVKTLISSIVLQELSIASVSTNIDDNVVFVVSILPSNSFVDKFMVSAVISKASTEHSNLLLASNENLLAR